MTELLQCIEGLWSFLKMWKTTWWIHKFQVHHNYLFPEWLVYNTPCPGFPMIDTSYLTSLVCHVLLEMLGYCYILVTSHCTGTTNYLRTPVDVDVFREAAQNW